MIRPSALQLAEKCGHARDLSVQFRESSTAAERGTGMHDEIHAASKGEVRQWSPEVASLLEAFDVTQGESEIPVQLFDITGEILLSEGTADFIYWDGSTIVVVDWKSGFLELSHPDDNLQILTYGLAAALKYHAARFRVAICFLRAGAPDFRWSRVYEEQDYRAIYDRIEAINAHGPEPVKGPHCDDCFARTHCKAFMLPVHDGPSALEPFTKPGGLTADNAAQAVDVVMAMKAAVKIAEGQLKAFAEQHGITADGREWAPTWCNGRETADVAALKRDGLTQYLKRGEQYARWGWRKAR